MRLLCLVSDLALDFILAVGVPVVLALPYWQQFDWEILDFPYLLYWDDIWLVNMIHELRIVLVSWWLSLLSDLTFALSLLIRLEDVKHLLHLYPPAKRPKDHERRLRFHNWILPNASALASVAVTTVHSREPHKLLSATKANKHGRSPQRLHERFVSSIHALLLLWGPLLLVLHLRASFRPSSFRCAERVWPLARDVRC